MQCKKCRLPFHYCANCGIDGLEALSEGYCCDECWKQHDPEGYKEYWSDDKHEMDCRDYPG